MDHAHHLEIDRSHLAGNGDRGRFVLLPGSAGRATRIAARLTGAVRVPNRRQLDVHLGSYEGVDVAVVPSGMGCPSVDIVVGELLQLGARRIVRLGTAGSLQRHVHLGDLVIASAAVRDESASDAYTEREYPAAADPFLVVDAARAAEALGWADQTHVGLVHSKDSFFGREFGLGPDAERNHAYMERLGRAGVLASEMEAAHLFVLGAVQARGQGSTVASALAGGTPVRCGAILAIIGTPEEGIAPLAVEQATEERLITLGVALAARAG